MSKVSKEAKKNEGTEITESENADDECPLLLESISGSVSLIVDSEKNTPAIREENQVVLPGYACNEQKPIILDKEHQNLILTNLEENSIPISYAVYRQNKKIMETELLNPGEYAEAPLYEMFSQGSYNIVIVADVNGQNYTFDSVININK